MKQICGMGDIVGRHVLVQGVSDKGGECSFDRGDVTRENAAKAIISGERRE